MFRIIEQLERCSRTVLVAAGLGILVLIGIVDYLTGFELMFSVFYLLEVGLAAWFVGKGFGVLMSCLSVVVWIGGDMAAGARFQNPLVPIWNAAILMVVYLIVVWLLTSLRSLYRESEARVQQRTQALRREVAERQRLEEEILQISEREQRRIGHDLHDSLCQHLTATALAGEVLKERLEGKSVSDAADAGKVVALIEEGITLARNLARGLHPIELEAEGLRTAFEDLADTVTKGTKVECVFECEAAVPIHDDGAATHLYRIAQEAVRNALRHARARRIGINLSERDGTVRLTVEDDGIGIGEGRPPTDGLGIRIMAHRAAMIGGAFSIEPNPTGGTIVSCAFRQPSPAAAPRTPAEHDA